MVLYICTYHCLIIITLYNCQVSRLVLSLVTTPPRGGLVVQTEADGRWVTQLTFLDRCPLQSPAEVACVKLPK